MKIYIILLIITILLLSNIKEYLKTIKILSKFNDNSLLLLFEMNPFDSILLLTCS